MPDDQPLILTLTLDAAAQAFFDRQRQAHFPPERNFLKAHLTLFHHLPPAEKSIIDTIENTCAVQAPMRLSVNAVTGIGRGVAYKVDCPPLLQLHARLQQQWLPWLIPQDRQKLWPHITVQNKVAPPVAKALQQQLAENFSPFDAWGTGLMLWAYEGGPWRGLQQFPFAGAEKVQTGPQP